MAHLIMAGAQVQREFYSHQQREIFEVRGRLYIHVALWEEANVHACMHLTSPGVAGARVRFRQPVHVSGRVPYGRRQLSKTVE